VCPKTRKGDSGKLEDGGRGPLLWPKQKEEDHATKESQRRADRVCHKAGEAGKKMTDDLPGLGVSVQAFLQREVAAMPVSGSANCGNYETRTKAQKLSGRLDARQVYSVGGAVKNSLKPAAPRQLVEKVRQAHQLMVSRSWADWNHALVKPVPGRRIRRWGSSLTARVGW